MTYMTSMHNKEIRICAKIITNSTCVHLILLYPFTISQHSFSGANDMFDFTRHTFQQTAHYIYESLCKIVGLTG